MCVSKSSSQSVRSLGAKVGALIRLRRQKLGLTQKELGQRVGLTAQQVQKYEQGANLMNLQRLVDFRQALGCPLERFVVLLESDTVSPQEVLGPEPTAKFFASEGQKVSVLREESAPFYYGQETPEGEGERTSELSHAELEDFLTGFFALGCESQRALLTLVRNLTSTRPQE